MYCVDNGIDDSFICEDEISQLVNLNLRKYYSKDIHVRSSLWNNLTDKFRLDYGLEKLLCV